jgi:hypothetical protein
MRKRGDPHAFEISKSFYFDTVAQHSGSTANAYYQQATGSLPGNSPKHIAGCQKNLIPWQQITGIDEGKPLTVSSVGVNLDLSGWVERSFLLSLLVTISHLGFFRRGRGFYWRSSFNVSRAQSQYPYCGRDQERPS